MKPARILALTAALLCSAAPAIAAQTAIGKVISLHGKAEIVRGSETKSLQVGSSIQPQDTIETSKKGIAEIQFNDSSIVTVGVDSELTIDQFVYNPEAPKENQSALRVGSGFFHFVSGKLARDKVSIQTPVSTIGIRGTELIGEVSSSGKTLVSLVQCCVDLRSSAGVSALNRVGTYSEVTSARTAPSKPDLTPDWWAKRAVAALGKNREDLGLSELEVPHELGPKNRTSFPYIK